MIRLFVALDLPGGLRSRLAILAGGLPGARWVPAENYHLTLRFIGEVPGHRADEIDGALAAIRCREFALALSGMGTFEKGGRPTALWVGAARNPALDHLQTKIETALQRIGLPAERRRFAPHVSLARVDGVPAAKLAHYLQANNLFRAELPIGHFTLFSSRIGKEQAVYTPEVDYALAPTG